jgi:hypothetical protein
MKPKIIAVPNHKNGWKSFLRNIPPIIAKINGVKKMTNDASKLTNKVFAALKALINT